MMMIRQLLQKNLSLIVRKHPAGIPLCQKTPTVTVKKEEIGHDGEIIYKKFHAPYFRAANLIVWKFYIETGTVHVCTGSDWFGSHICRDIVCRYNPGHSFVTGLPFLVRTVLGFNAKYYGAAESALAVATILGSIAAGMLAEKLKIHKLSVLLASPGIFIIPAGIVFILPLNAMIKYGVTVVSFCGMQAVISIFSVFAVSLIQQRTPNHLTGKVMAYTSTVTFCVQPIGQIVYGFLFDRFCSAVYFVLIPTGIIVCIVGLSAMSFFKNMEKERQEVSA